MTGSSDQPGLGEGRYGGHTGSCCPLPGASTQAVSSGVRLHLGGQAAFARRREAAVPLGIQLHRKPDLGPDAP